MNKINSNDISLTNALQKTISNTFRTLLVNPLKLKIGKWSEDEDEKLKNIVQEKGSKNWKKIAEYFENKSPDQCFYRWNRIIKASVEWTEDDIEKLKIWVQRYGLTSWTNCAKHIKGKTPKNCRVKWQQLSGDNDSTWTTLDEAYLLMAVNSYGTCWSKISKLFPTHLENSVKNKFYSILKRIADDKINQGDYKICDIKLSELLILLPAALEAYKHTIGDEIYTNLYSQFKMPIQMCQTDIISIKKLDTQINICSVCKDRLKQIIKKNLLSNMIKKTFNDYNTTDQMKEINNLEKLKNTSQKIDKLKEILKDVNKNILKFN
jgi:hypothetical protein